MLPHAQPKTNMSPFFKGLFHQEIHLNILNQPIDFQETFVGFRESNILTLRDLFHTTCVEESILEIGI